MKNKQRTTNNEQRTYKAFTLIELIVAVALLAMILSFSGLIFKVSIETYRTAGANAEIMQKLRAITSQLNADFKGIRTDAPLLMWFEQDVTDPNQRYDQVMFFANGDFQSTQLYDFVGTVKVPADTGEPVVGNVARIFYGQAFSLDPDGLKAEDRILARRQHILSADTELDDWPNANMSDFNSSGAGGMLNEWYEHDSLSLAQWKTIDWNSPGNTIVGTCFDLRPLIDMDYPNTFHKLMCDGVGSFAIQWAYWDSGDGRFYWFPSNDPDGDGDPDDSHFTTIDNKNEFGVYFNIPGSIANNDWYSIDVPPFAGKNFSSYPKAIKFTFRLYDSKGVIKNGRTFTHIVYLEN